ncbi:MAG: hypothetical protein HIU84_03920 [Acidobacteria bacterium]|nr:hypothetical protein [Acidobacteriota bacterium]
MRREISAPSWRKIRGGANGRLASLGILLVLVATSLWAPGAPVSASTAASGPLQVAGPTINEENITLFSLTTCRIFDGLTLVRNEGARPLRITAVHAVIPSETSPTKDEVTYQVRSLRAGSTRGAIGAVNTMTVLGGTIVGSAVGSVLEPIATSLRWYVVVFRVHVLQARLSPWAIRGVRVSYTLGARSYHALFRQTVRFPSTTC